MTKKHIPVAKYKLLCNNESMPLVPTVYAHTHTRVRACFHFAICLGYLSLAEMNFERMNGV